ncbi:MAG: L-aspartate oxidase [Thermoleophilales bacterium]|nr:L-aspartate oxidase [Thermoleophilales bacterium]
MIEADLAVVGAGAAGLYTALTAARQGARVALVSATALAQTASYWAQGGLAAALAAEDSPERHLQDTIAAGRGSARPSAVRVLCDEAPARVRELEDLGVRFDADGHGRLALGLEGGHGTRRVVHAGGSETGRRVTRQLAASVAKDDRVAVLERRRAAALWTLDDRCVGLLDDQGNAIRSAAVVLAAGGAAALWSRTTNPPGATGAALLLALDAGAALADLELMQFHPTAVVDPRRPGPGGRRRRSVEGFLVTEAIRGEGAVLLDAAGERFVDELAPRDEVARAIQARLSETGATAVGLDLSGVDPGRFPNVFGALLEAGIDPASEPVPVAPAAHYLMGGVATDLRGRTDVAGLYAVGECACTGLHGANRLASNSLTECFVFGRRAALSALAEPPPRAVAPPPRRAEAAATKPSEATRAALWELAGLERDRPGLERLRDDPYPLARLIAESALAREESRGAHRRRDFPQLDEALDLQHTVTRAGAAPAFERWE